MQKRKDSKGRLLRDGEIQRSDGKYEYRYYDMSGQRRSIYSWRLVESDRTPPGKKRGEPLRVMEEEIAKASTEHIDLYQAKTTTVADCVRRYLALKPNRKLTTKTNHSSIVEHTIVPNIGSKVLASLNYSDVKAFYLYLISEKNLQIGSLYVVDGILKPALKLAVCDRMIVSNPADGVLGEIRREMNWQRPKRKALTPEQQTAFVEFVANSNTYRRWAPLIAVLLGTGIRIGEATALCWEDCDFDKKTIHIGKTLSYVKKDGHWVNVVTSPKTAAGTRDIPMIEDVQRALLRQKLFSAQHGFCVDEINGYRGFVFHTTRGHVLNAPSFDRILARITNQYNKRAEQRTQSGTQPQIRLPNISAHTLRHTFCTRFCEVETDVKVIQTIMGHSDILLTMNVYNEVNDHREIAALDKLTGTARIC